MSDRSDGSGELGGTNMKRIYSVLVENRSGVLCKVAGLFSRRCFNIDSLAVGETDSGDLRCDESEYHRYVEEHDDDTDL